MRTVLLTGAQGYVGRHVAALLMQDPVRVVGVGRSPATNKFTHHLSASACGDLFLAPLPPALQINSIDFRYEYTPLDLSDSDATRRAIRNIRPDVVIHLAAALRDESWADLVTANVTAGSTLIEALGRLKEPPPVVFGSSGSVYGVQNSLPVSETALPFPVGLYSSSKLMGEIASQALAAKFGVQVTVARLFNLVGPGLQIRHLAARLVHQIAAIENGLLPRRIVTGPLHATRDVIDVRDAARMLVALTSTRTKPDVVNIGTGVETSVRSLARSLIARAESPINLQESETPSVPLGADRQAADTARAEDLGLRAKIQLTQSLDDMLAYARAVAAMPNGLR